jgi:acylphosphatase
MKTVRVIIAGRVQGVWFRGWTLETASHHGLDGWVRNRRDGVVAKVHAEAGASLAVDQAILEFE